MAINHIDARVLDGARMLKDMFANDAIHALERRIAWALDCARIDDVLFWLSVQEAMYGQPV